MQKICIQSGHWSKGGGAPNEMVTNKRIADRLTFLLRQRGFDTYQTDYFAFNDARVTKTDYDLFLALHCDMDYPNDGGSGFADYPAEKYPDGSIQDYAHPESKRICQVINDYYFPEVKINYVSHSNDNTRYYYMWKYLTAKTPCVLIEMGQSIDPHDNVLLGNTELIAGALYRAICKAFNVSYEIDVQNPPQPPVEVCDCEALKREIDDLKKTIKTIETNSTAALAAKDIECQEKWIAYKAEIIKFIKSL